MCFKTEKNTEEAGKQHEKCGFENNLKKLKKGVDIRMGF